VIERLLIAAGILVVNGAVLVLVLRLLTMVVIRRVPSRSDEVAAAVPLAAPPARAPVLPEPEPELIAEAAAEALSAARKALSDAPYQDQYHLTLAELAVRVRLAADGPAAGLDEAVGVTERYNLSRAAPPHGWPLAIALAHASGHRAN